MSDAHGVARDQLRAFVERIERLEEEKKTIADDIKDVYGEAKAMGYDTKIMKQVIALRKKDDQVRTEEDLIRDTYLAALGMIPNFEPESEEEAPRHRKQPPMAKASPRGDTVSEINPRLVQQVVTGMQTEAGRAALIAAVDIMIEREEAEEQASNGSNAGRPPQAARDAEESAASNSEFAPASQGEAEAPSVESVSATASSDANTGGSHVDSSAPRAGQADQTSNIGEGERELIKALPGSHPVLAIRPHCQHPGEEVCGGSGRNHCRACAAAMRGEEVA